MAENKRIVHAAAVHVAVHALALASNLALSVHIDGVSFASVQFEEPRRLPIAVTAAWLSAVLRARRRITKLTNLTVHAVFHVAVDSRVPRIAHAEHAAVDGDGPRHSVQCADQHRSDG